MAASPPIAVVAGHICLDIIPWIDAPAAQAGNLVQPGRLMTVGPAALSTGGAVSNTGLALHRLGIPTRLMGKVGDDLFGSAILDIVRRRDPALAAGMIVDHTSASSYTVVVSAPGFDRSFLHCPGANDTFAAADVPLDKVGDAGIFHFGYPPLMRRMYQETGRELVELFRQVQAHGVATSLDTAAVDLDGLPGQTDWHALLAGVMPHVDFFLPSFEEVLLMLDRPRFAEVAARPGPANLAAKAGIDLLRTVAQEVLALGAAVVGLKLGDQGMYLRTTPNAARLAACGKLGLGPNWRDRELLAPAHQVNVIGTTGAGDCAVAGFLAGVLRGLGPEAALAAAVGAGACNVEAADATSGVPTWETLQARLAQPWPTRSPDLNLARWTADAAGRLWRGPADRTTRPA
jgi:sugar/nucleoside kinase (ribokinase family)